MGDFWLVRWLVSNFGIWRRRYLAGECVVVPDGVHPDGVSFDDKVLAAIYIAAHGVDGGGISTWSTLMHPLKNFTLGEVEREASRFLGKAYLAVHTAVPEPVKLQILQDQAEHLSSE